MACREKLNEVVVYAYMVIASIGFYIIPLEENNNKALGVRGVYEKAIAYR